MTICATKDFGQFELVVFLPSHWIGCQGVRHHHQSRWQQLELITFARIVQYKLFWADYWSHSVALLGGGCQLCKAEICHILQKVIFCHQQNNFGDTDDGAGDFFPSSVFGCILYIFVEMSLCLLFCFHVLQDPDACSVGGKTSGYRLMVWHTVAHCGTLWHRWLCQTNNAGTAAPAAPRNPHSTWLLVHWTRPHLGLIVFKPSCIGFFLLAVQFSSSDSSSELHLWSGQCAAPCNWISCAEM